MNALIAQPPSAVFIDAGGVLILPNLREIADWMCSHNLSDLSDAELYGAFFRSFGDPDHERPEAEWLWEGFAREIGADLETCAGTLRGIATGQIDPWKEHPVVAPHATELLRLLSRAGIPAVVVSNSGGYIARKLETAGVCQVGDGELPPVAGVIDSHLVGVRKPDPRIFRFAREAVQQATGQPLELAETVHIGDTIWGDVAAADHAGIPVIHLDPESRCIERSQHAHATSLQDVPALIGLDF